MVCSDGVSVCVCVCVYVFVCMCVCVCVYVYVCGEEFETSRKIDFHTVSNCNKAVCIFVTTSTQHEGMSSAPINITSKQLSLSQLVSNTQQTGQTDM